MCAQGLGSATVIVVVVVGFLCRNVVNICIAVKYVAPIDKLNVTERNEMRIKLMKGFQEIQIPVESHEANMTNNTF